MERITVRHDGPHVLLIIDGKATVMPWNAALDVARAIEKKARKAEEIAKADQIIFDQALLIKTGAPLGFTDNPDIQKEAAKEAAHNETLRKSNLPQGVNERSQRRGQFGSPQVVRHKEGDADAR